MSAKKVTMQEVVVDAIPHAGLYEFLRAGLAWRDARREVFGRMGDYRKMDQYTDACDRLEKAVDAIQPPASSVQAPPTLEEALEASVAAVASGGEPPYGNRDNRRAQEQGSMRRRRG